MDKSIIISESVKAYFSSHASLATIGRIYHLVTYGLYLIPTVDYRQAMPPITRLLGKDIDTPDVVRAANLGSLKDLANDWRVPVLAVAAVEKTALVRPGPVHLEDVLGQEVSNYT